MQTVEIESGICATASDHENSSPLQQHGYQLLVKRSAFVLKEGPEPRTLLEVLLADFPTIERET